MATDNPPVQTSSGPSTNNQNEARTSNDTIINHDSDLLNSNSAHSSNRTKKICSSTNKFIPRIPDTVTHAFTPSSTPNNIQNLPKFSTDEPMPLTGDVTTIQADNRAKSDSPGLEDYRAPMNSLSSNNTTLLNRTADDPGQTPSPWSDTATSPEVCSWISSSPLRTEIAWIFASSSIRPRSNNTRRIASCLRRALCHIYDTPAEQYGQLTFPGRAAGAKKHYMSDPPVFRFKRGAKGLKKRGDKDVPFKRFVPNGLKLRPLNDKLFETVGCFFPQPSNMRYIESADYRAPSGDGVRLQDEQAARVQAIAPKESGGRHTRKVKSSLSGLPAILNEEDGSEANDKTFAVNEEDGPDKKNIPFPSVAGEAPIDYYGPAKDYAGSISSNSDSSDSGESITSTLNNFTDFDGDFSPNPAEDISAPKREVFENSIGTESDNISSDNSSSNESTNMAIHNEDEFDIFDGLNEPRIRLRADIPEPLEDLHRAIDNAFDHHLAELLVPCVRPTLPAGYMYAEKFHSLIHDDPHLIVSDDSGRFSEGRSNSDTEQEMPQWLKRWVLDAEKFMTLVHTRAAEEALESTSAGDAAAAKEARRSRLEHANAIQCALECVLQPPKGGLPGQA